MNRHHSSWVIRLFGCYYFKSWRCWMWCNLARMLIVSHLNMKWYRLQCAPSYLCMQLKSTHYEPSIAADRTGKWIFTDIWPDNNSSDCSSLLFCWSCLVTSNVSMLIWLAPGAEAKWSVRLKSLLFDVLIKTFCIKINAINVKKKETEAAVVSGVANLSSASAFKGLLHLKMKILSLITYPHVVPNLTNCWIKS